MDIEDAIETGAVSLGGVIVGLGLIIWHTVWWFRTTKRDWRPLVFPFVPLMLYGMLLILSAGGILGGMSNFALWGSNQIGRIALERGVGGEDTDATRSTSLVLESGGHGVVLLMTIAFVAVMVFTKETQSQMKGEGWIRKIFILIRMSMVLLRPVLAGICLGLSDGMAGWAAEVLAPAVDTLGGFLMGVL